MKTPRAVCQFKVTLSGIEPEIWRRVQVWEDLKLPPLHRVIQILFNWEDCHLHQFIAGRRVYSEPDPDDKLYGRKVIDVRNISIGQLAPRVGSKFEYHYDFGDNWRHSVLLEAILLPNDDAFYPRCIAGARNAPPEDSGGVGGYCRYLEALADPDHPKYETLLAWRGPFDPESFSLVDINASLKRSFYRRSPKRPVMPEPPRKKAEVADGAPAPLKLTDRERELILKHSLAPDVLTRPLQIVPRRGHSAVLHYTWDDLDDLAGHVAFESNHAKTPRLHKEWLTIFTKIQVILESRADEQS